MMDGRDAIAIQPHGRYVVARPRGQLSTQTVAATRRALVGFLRQSGVVADFSDLRFRDPGCVAGTIAASDARACAVDVMAVSDEQELPHILDGAGNGEGLVRFIRDWLGALLDYDVEHRSDLVKTLSVYLDRGGDYDVCARVLGIHRSTVRYRVHRIRELAGLDLGDACIWLNMHAATRALAHAVPAP